MSGWFFFIFMQPDKAPPIISSRTTSPRVRFTHKYGSVLVSVAAWTPAGSTVEATLSNFLASFDFSTFLLRPFLTRVTEPWTGIVETGLIRLTLQPTGKKTVVHKLCKCGRLWHQRRRRRGLTMFCHLRRMNARQRRRKIVICRRSLSHPNKSKHIQHAECDGLLFCPLDYTAAWLNMILTNAYDFGFALLTRDSTFLSEEKTQSLSQTTTVFNGWNKKCSKRARWVHQFSLPAQRGNHCNPFLLFLCRLFFASCMPLGLRWKPSPFQFKR